MALQDQCTLVHQPPFRASYLVAAIHLGIFEELLPTLPGSDFKVATYLLYEAALVNYYEPAWATLAEVAEGTGQRPGVVAGALTRLSAAHVVLIDTSTPPPLYRFNLPWHAYGSGEHDTRPPRRTATARLVARLAERDGYRCLACGRTHGPLEADHVVPRSKGGSGAIHNRQLLCGRCNRRKSARTIDYRPLAPENGGV